MLEKDPLTYSALTYAWVMILSIGGAVAHFLDKNRHSMAREKIKDLLIDMVIAPFTGVITFFLCESLGLKMVMTAAIIGLVSHMGSQALGILRRAALKRLLNTPLNETEDD